MPQSAAGKSSSLLESLPTELVEKIFSEALEVNLARASILIARQVSREAVYEMFLLQAYWNDPQDCVRDPHLHWNSAYQDIQLPKYDYAGQDIVAQHFSANRYQPLQIMEQEKLQRDVSSCRWFTLARFRQILPSLMTLTLNTVNYQWVCSRGLLEPSMNRDSSFAALDPSNGPDALYHDDVPRELEILDDVTIKGTYVNGACGRVHMIRTVRVSSLPEKVLHGPWTEDRLHLLLLLRRAFGKRFRWYDDGLWSQRQRKLSPDFSIQACFEGIEDAIVEKNEVALRYLLDVMQTFGPSKSSSRRGAHLPAKLYRLALRHAVSHPHMFDMFLEVGSNALPQTAHAYDWASERIAKGDWLSICAYSYLRKQKLQICDRLRVILSLPSRSPYRDKARVTQRRLLIGLARGAALDGEPIF
ncbi:hypothetical protein N7476_005118 [Penicillium atrosanguineum]|uniref:Uncharacterized protein n=1 Tax=Penicillium atrosanguineum TaxID=1132637 RepID=A0A9W9PYR3_9EURO|nr:hypothetical protein N7476_005118 [Penicillium atrosanguineum]